MLHYGFVDDVSRAAENERLREHVGGYDPELDDDMFSAPDYNDNDLEDMRMQQFYNRIDIGTSGLDEKNFSIEDMKQLQSDLEEFAVSQQHGFLYRFPPGPAYADIDNNKIDGKMISGQERMNRICESLATRYCAVTGEKDIASVADKIQNMPSGITVYENNQAHCFAEKIGSIVDTKQQQAQRSPSFGFGIDFSKEAVSLPDKNKSREREDMKQNTAYYHPKPGYSNTIGEMDKNGNIVDDGYSFDEPDDNYDTDSHRNNRDTPFDDLLEKSEQSSRNKGLGFGES